MNGQIINDSEKYHNHTLNITKIEARKAVKTLKTTAKHTEFNTQAVLEQVSLQVTIINNNNINNNKTINI